MMCRPGDEEEYLSKLYGTVKEIMEEMAPMTLDEAIVHADERSKDGSLCAREHAQLRDWLIELRERRAADNG